MSDQTDGPDPTEPADGTAPPPSDDATTPPGTDETQAAAAGADDDAVAAQETVPLPMTPPPATTAAPPAAAAAAASTRWPTSAKVWVGVLAVLALVAGAAAVAGFSEASSTGDDKTAVEAERDEAIDRAQSAEEERDELATALRKSEETVETLTNELAATTADLEEAQAANEVLIATVETERARAEEAQAELAAVGEVFPITVDTSLVGLDLAGAYTISFEEKYCDFATGCGTTPDANQAIIGVTPENFLDITIPGILQGGLFAVNGGLYAITDSETAIPPCGDVPRRGRVTITIWPSSIVVGEDGVAVPTALEASITLDAPTINECPSGLVFWGAKLIPAG